MPQSTVWHVSIHRRPRPWRHDSQQPRQKPECLPTDVETRDEAADTESRVSLSPNQEGSPPSATRWMYLGDTARGEMPNPRGQGPHDSPEAEHRQESSSQSREQNGGYQGRPEDGAGQVFAKGTKFQLCRGARPRDLRRISRAGGCFTKTQAPRPLTEAELLGVGPRPQCCNSACSPGGRGLRFGGAGLGDHGVPSDPPLLSASELRSARCVHCLCGTPGPGLGPDKTGGRQHGPAPRKLAIRRDRGTWRARRTPG